MDALSTRVQLDRQCTPRVPLWYREGDELVEWICESVVLGENEIWM